ncbi:MAG: hypothetical protein IH892_12605 [Planctomycetes bacterium]|nr:hypothetical protein [Planctomycetota bacterium]
MNNKFIKKYMRLAQQVGEDSNPCYSRHVGIVIVNPVQNRILSIGWNGPPRGVPHCDSFEHLNDIFWEQLSRDDQDALRESCAHEDEKYSPLFFQNSYRHPSSGRHDCPE